MIRGDQLTIGDYVLVDGKIRRVEQITKHKIGFHIDEAKKRLYYARLCEVFPIKIDKFHVKGLDGEVNDNIKIAFKCADFDFEQHFHTIKVSNCFGERLILREWHFHLLQHILRALHIDFEVKC